MTVASCYSTKLYLFLFSAAGAVKCPFTNSFENYFHEIHFPFNSSWKNNEQWGDLGSVCSIYDFYSLGGFLSKGTGETEDPKSGRDISSLLAHSLAFSPACWIRIKTLMSSCFPYLCINYFVYIWKNDHHVTRLKKKCALQEQEF